MSRRGNCWADGFNIRSLDPQNAGTDGRPDLGAPAAAAADKAVHKISKEALKSKLKAAIASVKRGSKSIVGFSPKSKDSSKKTRRTPVEDEGMHGRWMEDTGTSQLERVDNCNYLKDFACSPQNNSNIASRVDELLHQVTPIKMKNCNWTCDSNQTDNGNDNCEDISSTSSSSAGHDKCQSNVAKVRGRRSKDYVKAYEISVEQYRGRCTAKQGSKMQKFDERNVSPHHIANHADKHFLISPDCYKGIALPRPRPQNPKKTRSFRNESPAVRSLSRSPQLNQKSKNHSTSSDLSHSIHVSQRSRASRKGSPISTQSGSRTPHMEREMRQEWLDKIKNIIEDDKYGYFSRAKESLQRKFEESRDSSQSGYETESTFKDKSCALVSQKRDIAISPIASKTCEDRAQSPVLSYVAQENPRSIQIQTSTLELCNESDKQRSSRSPPPRKNKRESLSESPSSSEETNEDISTIVDTSPILSAKSKLPESLKKAYSKSKDCVHKLEKQVEGMTRSTTAQDVSRRMEDTSHRSLERYLTEISKNPRASTICGSLKAAIRVAEQSMTAAAKVAQALSVVIEATRARSSVSSSMSTSDTDVSSYTRMEPASLPPSPYTRSRNSPLVPVCTDSSIYEQPMSRIQSDDVTRRRRSRYFYGRHPTSRSKASHRGIRNESVIPMRQATSEPSIMERTRDMRRVEIKPRSSSPYLYKDSPRSLKSIIQRPCPAYRNQQDHKNHDPSSIYGELPSNSDEDEFKTYKSERYQMSYNLPLYIDSENRKWHEKNTDECYIESHHDDILSPQYSERHRCYSGHISPKIENKSFTKQAHVMSRSIDLDHDPSKSKCNTYNRSTHQDFETQRYSDNHKSPNGSSSHRNSSFTRPDHVMGRSFDHDDDQSKSTCDNQYRSTHQDFETQRYSDKFKSPNGCSSQRNSSFTRPDHVMSRSRDIDHDNPKSKCNEPNMSTHEDFEIQKYSGSHKSLNDPQRNSCRKRPGMSSYAERHLSPRIVVQALKKSFQKPTRASLQRATSPKTMAANDTQTSTDTPRHGSCSRGHSSERVASTGHVTRRGSCSRGHSSERQTSTGSIASPRPTRKPDDFRFDGPVPEEFWSGRWRGGPGAKLRSRSPSPPLANRGSPMPEAPPTLSSASSPATPASPASPGPRSPGRRPATGSTEGTGDAATCVPADSRTQCQEEGVNTGIGNKQKRRKCHKSKTCDAESVIDSSKHLSVSERNEHEKNTSKRRSKKQKDGICDKHKDEHVESIHQISSGSKDLDVGHMIQEIAENMEQSPIEKRHFTSDADVADKSLSLLTSARSEAFTSVEALKSRASSPDCSASVLKLASKIEKIERKGSCVDPNNETSSNSSERTTVLEFNGNAIVSALHWRDRDVAKYNNVRTTLASNSIEGHFRRIRTIPLYRLNQKRYHAKSSIQIETLENSHLNASG